MAVFDEASIEGDWFLWQLHRFGPVTLYYRPMLVEAAIQHLRQREYVVHEFDCQKYDTEEAILSDVAFALGVLHDYDLHPNLDGFNDYLYDLVVPNGTGTVLAFKSFDTFQHRFPYYAHSLLDIVAKHYHSNLLFGLRFIALVQTNDPSLKIEKFGAFSAHWNDAELMTKNRTS